MTGILFVISAPSGTGKSTVARSVVEAVRGLRFSVSHTTRPPRPGELDGREYHFVERQAFEKMARQGAFLEWAEVFGNLYGTGLETTRRALGEGTDLMLDIDVQGASQVRSGPVPAVLVMILPPDFVTLEGRLRGRASEGEDERRRRLARARREAESFEDFDYVVVNERVERAVEQVVAIIRAERQRTLRWGARVREILSTFPDSD